MTSWPAITHSSRRATWEAFLSVANSYRCSTVTSVVLVSTCVDCKAFKIHLNRTAGLQQPRNVRYCWAPAFICVIPARDVLTGLHEQSALTCHKSIKVCMVMQCG